MNKVTTNKYPYKANRAPLKDVEGDKNSLGILLMDAKVLNECRLLSGEGETYKHEYAVWYSSHDTYVNIGSNTLTISRPYSFYNINQVTGSHAVKYDADDRLMLNEIDKELNEEYKANIINSEGITAYNNKVLDIIKRYYTLSHFNNDLSQFRDEALAELHVTEKMVEDLLPVVKPIILEELRATLSSLVEGSEEYNAVMAQHTEKELEYIAEDRAYDLAVEKLLDEGYEVNKEIKEEEVEDIMLQMAIRQLEESNFILLGSFGDMTEEEKKDVIDNEKLVISWYLSNFHTFHAHPKGVNSFSGSIGGKTGDLMNDYKETFNRSTGEWEQTSTSEVGIVYQFVNDINSNPIPSYSGVVQQINRATTLIFNELRMWKCTKDEYKYSRTPSLTYVKGFAPELEEVALPKLAKMIGKTVPKPSSHNYVIPFMGAATSDMAEEIFDAYLSTPVEVLYDIDADRITQKDYRVSNQYGYDYSYDYTHKTVDTPKTYYLENKKAKVDWLMSHISELKKDAIKRKTMVPTKKSLSRLNSENLNKKMDTVAVSCLFDKDNGIARKYVKKFNKIFHIFGIDFFAFIDGYQSDYEYSSSVVDYLMSDACPTDYQWDALSKNKVKFNDIIGKSKQEISALVTSSTVAKTSPSKNNTSNGVKYNKTNWPLNEVELARICTSLGIKGGANNSAALRLYNFKKYIFDIYKIPTAEQENLWDNLAMLDINVYELLHADAYCYSIYLLETVGAWTLPRKETEALMSCGHAPDDLLLLSRTELEKLLVEGRRNGVIPFTKNINTQGAMAKYLSTKHKVFTVKKANINYGVSSIVAREEVEEQFNKLYSTDLQAYIPKHSEVSDVMYIIDMLSIDKVELIEHENVDSIIAYLVLLPDAHLNMLKTYVSEYTDNIKVLTRYTKEELSALVKVKDDTVLTYESIQTAVLMGYKKALGILNDFGIFTYTTYVDGKACEVNLNETNYQFAITNLVLKHLCEGLSKKEATKVIKVINYVEADVEEMLDMPMLEYDKYLNLLLEFDLDYTTTATYPIHDYFIDWKYRVSVSI